MFVYSHYSPDARVRKTAQLLTVEIVNTDKLRNRGLSGLQSMDKEIGILYLFEKRDIYTFWMNDQYD